MGTNIGTELISTEHRKLSTERVLFTGQAYFTYRWFQELAKWMNILPSQISDPGSDTDTTKKTSAPPQAK